MNIRRVLLCGAPAILGLGCMGTESKQQPTLVQETKNSRLSDQLKHFQEAFRIANYSFANCSNNQPNEKAKWQPNIENNNPDLRPLPYSYNYLEPQITAEMLSAHHDHHHQTYVTKLKDHVSKNQNYQGKSLLELLSLAKEDLMLQRHAGGHYNHVLYWWVMTNEKNSTKPSGALLEKIEAKWGSFEKFKEEFFVKSRDNFGSGWTWLAVNQSGDLVIINTDDHINPLMGVDGEVCYPFFVNDIWEHAYYLKYKWDRPGYINSFFQIVDWDMVNHFYEDYASQKKPVPL